MTIVGLHDFVKVSILASLMSFLLIMCIHAPESTTSRSSGLRVDAGKHLFSEDEKNVALSCSFNFNTFLASFHAASRAPNSCHSVPSSNFGASGLLWWGSPGKIYPSEEFGSRIFVWRVIALVNFTRCIGFCMSELFRKIDFGGFMSWKTQPNCRAFDDRRPLGLRFNSWQVSRLISGRPDLPWLFVTVHNKLPYVFVPIIILQHGYCTFNIILLGPFPRLFLNLTMCIRALLLNCTTTLGHVEQAFWRVPLSQNEWVQDPFW